jgi:hypothetical protein
MAQNETLPAPATILERAVTANSPPEVIEKLMMLQERWERREAEKAYAAAIAAVKPELPPIIKNNWVDQGKGRPTYAHEDLAEIVEKVDPVLAKHGLSYRWKTKTTPDHWVHVTCVLSHAQGHQEESSMDSPPDTTGGKNAVQARGSTMTYLERYTLKAVLGIAASKDDDGRGGPRKKPQTIEASAQVVDPETGEVIDGDALDELLNNGAPPTDWAGDMILEMRNCKEAAEYDTIREKFKPWWKSGTEPDRERVRAEHHRLIERLGAREGEKEDAQNSTAAT